MTFTILLVFFVLFIVIIIIKMISDNNRRRDIIDDSLKNYSGEYKIDKSANNKFFAIHKIIEKSIEIGTVASDNIVDLCRVDNIEVSNSFFKETIDNSWIYIAFDNTNEQLFICQVRDTIAEKSIIKYNNILEVEILTNGVTVSKKSATRTIGGSLIGGAIFGGAGAVVGGLSGDSVSHEKINSIKIKILIKDMENPSITLDWWKSSNKEGCALDDTAIQTPYINCNTIKDIISVIINNEDDKAEKLEGIESSQTISVADEIIKLVQLKDMGVITDEEFENQKSKLLS